MSLLTDSMEDCIIVNRQKVNDGYGGFRNEWVDGAAFQASIVLDSSLQARVAEKQGVTNLYTVTTSRSLNLEFNEYFRRERDGKLFRVTSSGEDRFTPASATLDMRQVNAEQVEALPG